MATGRIALITCLLCSAILADIAPFGRGPRSLPSITRPVPWEEVADTESTITMDSASVKVVLRKIKTRGNVEFIQADVNCDDFTLSRKAVGYGALPMAFPYATENENVTVSRFSVVIDGHGIPNLRRLQNWSMKPCPGVRFQAYAWQAPLFSTTQHVKVSYRLLLPMIQGKALFRYVLRSGALWAGPIPREIVTIKAEGLVLRPTDETRQKPEVAADGSLVWKLRNVRPLEDIVLTVAESR